jgi:macrolide transport system ATP-binding/permease protein
MRSGVHFEKVRAWIVRLGGMFSHDRRDRDFADELESHLQMHIDDHVRAGMRPDAARRAALVKLGGVERTREAYRDRGTAPFIEHLLQDVRYALRQWRKRPAFAATAVFILALGIGASVAIFGFVDAALLKPLPYRDPARLAALFESTPLGPQFHLSYLNFLDWKRQNHVFSAVEAYDGNAVTLSTSAGAQQLDGAIVTAGFFRTLGVTPILGRDFRDGEDLPAAPRTVMLSYAAWQQRFGGRGDVVGQTLTLSGAPSTIIGVLPRDFHFAPAGPAEIWAAMHAACADDRGCHNLSGLARLRDGVSLQTAAAEMTVIARQLERQYPDANGDRGATVMALTELIVGGVRPLLLLLLAGAGLLLLIAAVNVASLLLVRSETRTREIAVRAALGASRARLVSQFLAEGFVLAIAGGLLGVVAAVWAMRLLLALIPAGMRAGMPYLNGLGLTGRVTLVAAAISVIAGLLFSLIPTSRLLRAHAAGRDMRDGLAEGSRGSAGTVWRRFGAHLVVIELATAMVLLVGAGLLGKSAYRLLHVEVGMQPDHLAMLRVAASAFRYPTETAQRALARRIVDGVASLPGVRSVGLAHRAPVGNAGGTTTFSVVGKPAFGAHLQINDRPVSAGYFATLQARLLRGRYFTDADAATVARPRVVVVNQAMARQFFAGEDPLGRTVIDDDWPDAPLEIIGVIDDIKEGPLDQAVKPMLYVLFDQLPASNFFVIVRTSQEEQSVLAAVAGAIRRVDPAIQTSGAVTMQERIHDSPSAYLHRVSAALVGGFAAIAWLLGVVGLYGVIAYSVSQRRREVGIRIALGAHPRAVYRLILRDAGRLTAAGLAVGLVCAVAAATLMRTLLFGVDAWDVPTLSAVTLVVMLSALLASYIPARRAAAINPVDALSAE